MSSTENKLSRKKNIGSTEVWLIMQSTFVLYATVEDISK